MDIRDIKMCVVCVKFRLRYTLQSCYKNKLFLFTYFYYFNVQSHDSVSMTVCRKLNKQYVFTHFHQWHNVILCVRNTRCRCASTQIAARLFCFHFKIIHLFQQRASNLTLTSV